MAVDTSGVEPPQNSSEFYHCLFVGNVTEAMTGLHEIWLIDLGVEYRKLIEFLTCE